MKHTLADGSWHFDWLIARTPDAGARPQVRSMVTFRVPPGGWATARGAEASRGAGAGGVLVERLADHRAAFLVFEGELSPGPAGEARGRVERVAAGTARWVADEPGRVVVDADWKAPTLAGRAGRYACVRGDDGLWRLTMIAGAATEP